MNNHALSGTTTISASGDISGGTITTTIGSISSTSGSKHTHNGTVSRKVGSFQTSACTGKKKLLTQSIYYRIFMGLDTTAAAGMKHVPT